MAEGAARGKLEGKVALVTGSTLGIGRATARLFAAEGARVVVNGLERGEGERTIADIRSGGGVVVEQHVEDLAVLVDGPVQGAFLRAPVPKEEDLVHLPCPAGPSTVLADRRREPRPEGLDPPQDGPFGGVDAPLPRCPAAPLGEEHQHAAGGERVAQLPADRQQDHLRRPTVPREGRHRSRREGTVAGPTQETLAAGAVAAVALGGRTPAGGTTWHKAWALPATDGVADSRSATTRSGSRCLRRSRRATATRG
ncbi:MAG TPA: SDR family NAD(P)-dependent oxidoreductase [Chloroflexota bacterium]|nr:SDR family NAD(P)-dependent oxidoreductase [Chloroflexota bacterium]